MGYKLHIIHFYLIIAHCSLFIAPYFKFQPVIGKRAGSRQVSSVRILIQNMADTISLIAGQKAVITLAKKSVAGFKAREGSPSGIKVTLRGDNMYNFLDKLISIALPRVKDFRGVSRKGFDGRGNYNFGLDEQLMFPEVVYDDIMKTHGMNITIVTSSEDDKGAFVLLEKLGMPFAKGRK